MSGSSSFSPQGNGTSKSGMKVQLYKSDLQASIVTCGLPEGFEKEIFGNVSTAGSDRDSLKTAIKQSFPDGMKGCGGLSIAQLVAEMHELHLTSLYDTVIRVKGAIEEHTGLSKWID